MLYCLKTNIQADKSFNFSLAAAVVSLLLIIFGIVLSLFGQTNSATVSAGAGVLGEFISAVFFYLYNQTIAKMADYHRKLVFTQNIGLALKISDGLTGNEKTEAQRALARLRGLGQFLMPRPLLINGLSGKVFTTEGGWVVVRLRCAVAAEAAN